MNSSSASQAETNRKTKRNEVSSLKEDKSKRQALEDITNKAPKSGGKLAEVKKPMTRSQAKVQGTSVPITTAQPIIANTGSAVKSSKQSKTVEVAMGDVRLDSTDKRNRPVAMDLQCKDIHDLMEVVQDHDNNPEEDLLFCQAYSADIYQHLREKELSYQARYYLPSNEHKEINTSMRSILIDWLVEVCSEYKLNTETLYLTVNYVDRYLSKKTVVKNKLQLLGVACMLIASKFEEVYAPAVDEFVFISDNCYKKEEIFEMETAILNELGFCLVAPTTKTFLKRFLIAAGINKKSKDGITMDLYAHYLSELTMLDFVFIQYPPSMIASAVVYLTLHTVDKIPWNENLQRYTGYGIEIPLFRECITHVRRVITDTQRSYQAIHKKYMAKERHSVARITPAKSLPF
eukprot:TRINITY_DN4011_c0_g1_i1.p1 TRINITY_DN4011_c0_g1~~TRINITY_DN4011_c0_g1_i1.p1  ORF type:complete len:404 (-),score=72.33 TRINITY_DN4011_c0_g1_i1:396-1607(-)